MGTHEHTEKQFQSLIVQYAKRCGWLCVFYSIDSRRRLLKGKFPDLVLVRNTVLYRELKTEMGRLTPAQKAWGDRLTEAGADYQVWRPKMLNDIFQQLSKGR